MLKVLWSSLLVLSLTIGAPMARAATDAATAETLLRQSGLWAQLASLEQHVRSGVLRAQSQAGKQASASELDRLMKIIGSAYGADRLRGVAAQVIQSDTDAQHLPALQAWFATELAHRVRQQEEAAAASQGDPQQTMTQGAARLQAMSPARRELLADIARTTDAAEAVTQMMISMTLATHRGLRSVLPGMPGPTTAELDAALQAQRPQMIQAFGVLSVASNALAYEGLGDDELGQYLAFLRSPAGQHANQVGVRAFTAALVAAAADMGQRLPGSSDKANT